MKSTKGFTLVEALVIIVIIAVLASVGVVAYRAVSRTVPRTQQSLVRSITGVSS